MHPHNVFAPCVWQPLSVAKAVNRKGIINYAILNYASAYCFYSVFFLLNGLYLPLYRPFCVNGALNWVLIINLNDQHSPLKLEIIPTVYWTAFIELLIFHPSVLDCCISKLFSRHLPLMRSDKAAREIAPIWNYGANAVRGAVLTFCHAAIRHLSTKHIGNLRHNAVASKEFGFHVSRHRWASIVVRRWSQMIV